MAIVIDGHDWETELDLIEAIIKGVDGPFWHGRNYNALYDSLVIGSVNGIDPPYDFVIRPPANPTPELAAAISYFLATIEEWRTEGAGVSARVTS